MTNIEKIDFIKIPHAKFDESLDIDIRLNIDTKKVSVRGNFNLVYGIPKNINIVAIVPITKEKEAIEAGATKVGLDDIIQEIESGKFRADIVICTPDAFAKLSKVAKQLGMAGIMPNKKDGTVTDDISETINNIKSGRRVNVKSASDGHVRLRIGKCSFHAEHIKDNIKALLEFLKTFKPEKKNLKDMFGKVVISSTMGSSIEISIRELL